MTGEPQKGVVLAVTGGIAAYKAAGIASALVREGVAVRTAMTEHAGRFIAPLTFATLTGSPVATDMFASRGEIDHISLARFAAVMLVAPATANFIGKYAAGVADDIVTTTALTVSCPVIVCPAMNGGMWRHPAVQENVRKLRGRGVEVVGPAEGHLACGDDDIGRLAPENEILQAVYQVLERK